ncbi:Cytochrome P450 monooxygenase 64 [Psilocybe cubensis]|uniref:Cytochrome P450 n=2 Tax=Psilocybe cubensis TaxID=181762 RepID=A0A8H7XLL1_PSICU|nr:Cytochrome P450 monooxygenase 64 [Psilocybe cubensis]KAH9474283.1 Cytochrome P450 monooxygenase 64 [Psilocybe cubensis]
MGSIVEIVFLPQIIAVLAFCITLLTFIHYRVTCSGHRLPLPVLPPGPSGRFVFGNFIPTSSAHLYFESLTQQYGPIFTLRQGFNTVIVIGRLRAAADIMEKEGLATVDRPRSIAVGDTLSGGMRLVMTPVGEQFRKFRRAIHSHLRPQILPDYAVIIARNAKQHIIDIINDPSNHQGHAKRYAASVVMEIAYGKQPKLYTDPEILAINQCSRTFGLNLRPGLWMVDAYPILRYIPGYLKELQDAHVSELALFKRLLYEVQTKMKSKADLPASFSRYLLERQSELGLSDSEIAYLAGSMFGAGSDTTASAISISIIAAACYPEAQRRVQDELDAVIGRKKAPASKDQDMLPQTMAFVLETFRWRPVVPGGIAHRTTRDIIWENYLIPKGATIIGNTWSIGRDPNFFEDPESFNPQRWLAEDGRIKQDLKSYSFGFGRRVCPGQYMATSSVFVNTALLQWAFKISPDPAAPIDKMAFTDGVTTHPLPFNVNFKPRITSSMDAIKELLGTYEI